MRRRILLADDSVTIQKVIELTFLDEDYEVKAVSNGDEAIAALPQVSPDFVIADVHMPGANGYEVCRRSKELLPDVPVLLLVGTFEPFDEGQSRAVGADSFLKKPFDSQELLQRVEELIASRSPAAAPPAPGPSATDWGSFQLEPSPVPPPADPFPAPTPFPLEEDRPFPAYSESSFDESPFQLDQTIDESAILPAGEPMFDLDAAPDAGFEPETPAFETPSFEPPSFDRAPDFAAPPETPSYEAPSFETPFGFTALPEERLGVPEGAVPLVESRAETEARIEAPPPPSIEASHEPESSAPATAPVIAAPVGSLSVGAASPANGGGSLSDEDVDRIARRVVELMADRAIRDVAWEVIPDMAEMVIRDRLLELESQAESFE
ncbi:MAG TPA: response regulator [Thermoanaerobaculia bacterium]|nr:response regulator [Thermoanaerobaculia bacterium]